LHFPPKNLNNLFMFLSNEQCYYYFKDYLIKYAKDSKKALNYLNFYTDYLIFKLKQYNNEDDIHKNFGLLYNKYFIEGSLDSLDHLFNQEIINHTRDHYNNSMNEANLEIFDKALCFVFEQLEDIFTNGFQNNELFKGLSKKISLNSDIFCRMYNTGLIKKN